MKPLTEQEKAAGGNGDARLWQEYEAEGNRDPAEYAVRRGRSETETERPVGYMTNAEMFRLIRRLIEAQYDDVMTHGCCQRMDEHGFCQYLQQQCPHLVKGDGDDETDGSQGQVSEGGRRNQAGANDDQGRNG